MTIVKRMTAPLLAFVTALLAFGLSLSAQCATNWTPGSDLPWPGGSVHATTTWDPDGTGPATALLVFGGRFQHAGNIAAANIVAFDTVNQTWLPLGLGLDNQVQCLHVNANGELFAGGFFTNSGATSCNYIARWNGAGWSAIGTGSNAGVYAIESLGNGDLVIGGEFTSAGGQTCNSIAAWNGTTWSPLSTGLTGIPVPLSSGPLVHTLTTRPNGDLIAAGVFGTAGGTPAGLIARWDGAAWSSIALPPLSTLNPQVNAAVNLPNGDLLVSATFSQGGNEHYAATWNGTQWLWTDQGLTGSPHSLCIRPNGTVLASGNYFVGFGDVRVAEWTGTTWVPFSTQPPVRFSIWPGHNNMLNLPNGDLHISSDTVAGTAIWNGATWSTPSPGTDGIVAVVIASDDDRYFVGGLFTQIDQTAAAYIAEWNGTAYSALGLGVNGPVHVMTRAANGDLLAAGSFSNAGGQPANSIARWDGSSWSALGSGFAPNFFPPIYALATMPNGDVIAAGNFQTAGGVAAQNIARWDGTAWTPLGSGLNSSASALTIAPNGDLIAGGNFNLAGGNLAAFVARWDGSNWSAVGTGLASLGILSDAIYTLAYLPNGDLVVGGEFQLTNGGPTPLANIARWDGAAWHALGSGSPTTVYSITALPNGAMLAGGDTMDSLDNTFEQPRRWNGSSWSLANAGIDQGSYQFLAGSIKAMALTSSGALLMGGDFVAANGAASAFFATQASACPALATVQGSGCTGSAGLVSQTVVDLPWLASTFASSTSGMPSNSLAIGVLGLNSIALPLPSILPQGVAGCMLLASPDVLRLYVPNSGTVLAQFPIANASVLIGAVLEHQIVPIEFHAAGNILELTSSNSLQLTIGTF